MIKEYSIKLDTSQINYVVFGTGKEPLVLIPGLSLQEVKGRGFFIAYTYRVFSKKYRVYCFDKRNDISENATVEQFADDVCFCMKRLHIANANILGISQGGMIAQYLAIKYPDMVKKLCLGVTLSKNNQTVIDCVDNWLRLAEKNLYEDLIQDIFEKMYSESYLKKYKLFLPLLKKIGKPKNSTRFINMAKACLTCNTYNELLKIKCPVFVLGGKKDKITEGKSSEEIAEKLNCPIYMYEDYGHSAYAEAKDFNKRVFDFFINY